MIRYYYLKIQKYNKLITTKSVDINTIFTINQLKSMKKTFHDFRKHIKPTAGGGCFNMYNPFYDLSKREPS